MLEVGVMVEHVVIKLVACEFNTLLECFVNDRDLVVVDLLLLLKFEQELLLWLTFRFFKLRLVVVQRCAHRVP